MYHGWCDANNLQYHRIGYVNKNRHYKHEYEACKIILSSQNIVDFYTSRRETRDDIGGHQTLRNKDQIVFEGLQNVDIQAELVAADAMRYAFYSPFLVMVKHEATDVLTVGQFIRQFHQMLTDVADNEAVADDVLHGRRILFDGRFGDEFTKPVGFTTYGEDITKQAEKYLRAGCKSAAAGLYSISREYFSEGGQYYEPTVHMSSVLSGLDGSSYGQK